MRSSARILISLFLIVFCTEALFLPLQASGEQITSAKWVPVKDQKAALQLLFEAEQESEEVQDGREDGRVIALPIGEVQQIFVQQEVSAGHWFQMTQERHLSRTALFKRLHSFLI